MLPRYAGGSSLLSQAQQLLDDVEAAPRPGNDDVEDDDPPVWIREDVYGDIEEDTEEDSVETHAYLQRLIWWNTVMNRWPRSEH